MLFYASLSTLKLYRNAARSGGTNKTHWLAVEDWVYNKASYALDMS